MGGIDRPSASEPVLIHDDGVVVYASAAILSLVGVESRKSILGRSLLEFITQSDRNQLAKQFEQVAQDEGPPLALTTTIEGATTPPTRCILLSSPVEWDGRDCIQTLVIDTDATLPDGLSADTMDATPVGISIADASRDDNPHIYVNDGFVELTGYPREEVLGRNCRFLQGEATEPEPVAELRSAIANQEPVTVELRNYRKDGTMFWNRVSVAPIWTDDGDLAYYLGFQEDISARKAFEHEKKLFELQAESVDKSICITDTDGTIEYVNPQFERKTGYSAVEAIGRNPRILKSGDQDATFYEELWATITAGEVWEAEITNRRKSGERYQVHQKILPVTDAAGEITHFVAIEDDITDTQFIEEIVDVMDRVLRHNVRTSVQAIEGYAEVLDQEELDADQRAALRVIREQAAKLDEISEQVRDIRKLFEHRHEQDTLPVSELSNIIQEHRERHPHAEIDLSMELPAGVEIQNGRLLEVALDEALDNAIRHNDSSHPRVEITVQQVADGTDVRVAIADNGPGIPHHERAAIASGRETPLVHGTGIGLWMMYWTLTALGGTLELPENDPRGSTIIFRVPIDQDESVPGWNPDEGNGGVN